MGAKADELIGSTSGVYVAAEVKVKITDDDYLGPVGQAVKYRALLDVEYGLTQGSSRAILVAHEISRKAKNYAQKYGVECMEVAR